MFNPRDEAMPVAELRKVQGRTAAETGEAGL
jgi:hypothetical protein